MEFPAAPTLAVRDGRRAERHSHDIFLDQVRWMNRLKLELDERFGAKVTSNALVQAAIDMLRHDFERNGERSELFRTLVRAPDAASAATKEGGA